MRITAVTKLKHGALHSALRKLGWSQSELARRTEIHPCEIGKMCNLLRRPTVDQANRIQSVLAGAGVYIDPTEAWPETFKGFRKTIKWEETRDFTDRELASAQIFTKQLGYQPDSRMEKIAVTALRHLNEKDREAMEMLCGFNGEPMNQNQIAAKMKVANETVRFRIRRAKLVMNRICREVLDLESRGYTLNKDSAQVLHELDEQESSEFRMGDLSPS